MERNVEIEKRIERIAASFAFENMELTEENKENMRKVLNGERPADEIIKEIENKYGLTKNGH